MPVPAISVIMPLYNKERDVYRAVHSVLSQTFREFELVVVNDGSTDRGPDIVRAVKDNRIKIIDEPNAGASAARNRGIIEAKADLVAFLDADDEWTEDYLETILSLVSKFPDASVFATGYMFKQSGGLSHRAIIRGLPTDFSEGILQDYFAVAVHSDPPLWTSAVVVRKKAIESVNRFPVGISAGEDLLTWARLAVRYNIAYSMPPKATFYAPGRMEDRPSRRPQIPDRVAEGLRALLDDAALSTGARKGLSEYIGLWHRMRAVVFIKLNDGAAARRELFSTMHNSGLSLRLMLLLFISLLPSRLMADSFHMLSRFRSVLNHRKP